MNSNLVLERNECYSSDGIIEDPNKLKNVQEQCEHDIAFESEGIYGAPVYECMLCGKRFKGFTGQKLPCNTYVVPYRVLSNMNIIYKDVINIIASNNKNINDIDVVTVIKELDQELMKLDEEIDNPTYLNKLDETVSKSHQKSLVLRK